MGLDGEKVVSPEYYGSSNEETSSSCSRREAASARRMRASASKGGRGIEYFKAFYRVARSGPFATFLFARFLEEMPSRWSGLPRLPMFQLENARAALAAADRDPFINHWQSVPIALWCLSFVFLGIGRLIRQRLSLQLFVVAFSIIAIGTIADLASCALAYGQPRYTLPLLITIFVSGCVLLFGPNQPNKLLPSKTSRFGNRSHRPVAPLASWSETDSSDRNRLSPLARQSKNARCGRTQERSTI